MIDRNDLFFHNKATFKWPHRLTVRTSGFHPENSGSIPGGVTTKTDWKIDPYPKKWTQKCPLFDSVKLLSYEQKNIHKGTDR